MLPIRMPIGCEIKYRSEEWIDESTILGLEATLWKHLAEIDEECNEMMDRLVGQMAKSEGVTEQLKSNDWLCWLQKMNSIRSRAEEIVLHDLIYSL